MISSVGITSVLRRYCVGAALVLLTGCAAQPTPPDLPLPLRNPTVPLGGTARFDAGAIAGDWVTRACLGRCADRYALTQSLTGAIVVSADGGERAYLPRSPGVLREVEGDSVLVVMWVDEGFRTAALGDVDGRWAAIIDRAAKGGADRIEAAREILDFNGWDVAQLRRVSK